MLTTVVATNARDNVVLILSRDGEDVLAAVALHRLGNVKLEEAQLQLADVVAAVLLTKTAAAALRLVHLQPTERRLVHRPRIGGVAKVGVAFGDGASASGLKEAANATCTAPGTAAHWNAAPFAALGGLVAEAGARIGSGAGGRSTDAVTCCSVYTFRSVGL